MKGKWYLAAIVLHGLTLCSAAAVDLADDDPRLTPVVRAYARIRPAVVNISTQKVVALRLGSFGGDLFPDFFPNLMTRRVPVQSLGSGFIISPAGYIITNAHVVLRAEKITVTMADGSRHPARAISSDSDSDLAVLKITPPAGRQLPYLPLGRSDDLMVGETVIVVGNPLGYANSLTTGVISATDRVLDLNGGKAITGLIQTDAPINRGNSGGPLLNIKGELIGINTAIRPDAQNIGFAIPADRLTSELPALLDCEKLNRAVFGVEVMQDRTPAGDRLSIAKVQPGSPADGVLAAGDRILALDGLAVRQVSDYACAMAGKHPGDAVQIKYMREGRELDAGVVLASKPRPNGQELAYRHFGLTLRELTPQLSRRARLAVTEGLVVTDIERDSPADKLGLDTRDVIFQMGRFYVADLDELGTVLENLNSGEVISLGIIRGNVRIVTTIKARQQPQPVGL